MVHPRAGGEHYAVTGLSDGVTGSSPRGRGTQSRSGSSRSSGRFIPARAGNTARTRATSSTTPVHPRAGGEHQAAARLEQVAGGSSPRGRGTRQTGREGRADLRFIPARAGNTTTPGAARTACPVHPRAGGEHAIQGPVNGGFSGSSPRGRGTPSTSGWGRRGATVHPRAGGEHANEAILAGWEDGSSPRGRGTPGPHRPRPVHDRFIPARAGNTRSPRRRPTSSPVHPRAGGEHPRETASETASGGSSPRGRGTHAHPVPRPPRLRFIPARAGNTNAARDSAMPQAVHPRAGGEHSPAMVRPRLSCGSSPRGRGTQRGSGYPEPLPRFIPARAGNTPRWARPSSAGAVHPRAGGEHSPSRSASASVTGSSPRGRGTRAAARRGASCPRFIPARAGNTPTRARENPSRTVHPRAGGEHRAEGVRGSGLYGSSPRGRGTRAAARRGASCPRFIPARAGNTADRLKRSSSAVGSSPRGRGTRRERRREPHPRRFIPARAGNTPRRMPRALQPAVHPRAGGEHLRSLITAARDIGSSPRGRGTPLA